MTKTVLILAILAAMLITAPSTIMAQTDVGVESETKADVGVKVGSEDESSSESSAEAEGESRVEAKGEVKTKSETETSQEKSQSSSSDTRAENMKVTTMAGAKASIGLPVKYPMPSVSASNSIVLQTNQHLYKPGDTLTVEGSLYAELLSSLSGTDTITIKVLDRQRNVIHESNVQINSDGKYSTTFMLPNNSAKGAYTVTSQINADTDLSDLGVTGKVNLGASTKIVVVAPQVFNIEVENHGEYDVRVASNSTVNDVRFNGDQKKVSVDVEGQTGTKGVTHISVPKEMVSGQMKVMIDGEIVSNDKVVVTKNTQTETEVEVNYSHSVHTIDVVGTQAVPEFGTIAVLILAVAIISIVAVTSKSRLSIMPKI